MTRLAANQLTHLAASVKDGMSLKEAADRLPARSFKRKRSYEESESQQSVFSWWAVTHKQFNVPQCLMFAIPNGSALGNGREDWQVLERMKRGKRAKAEGLTSGVFDIFLSVPKLYQRPCATDPDKTRLFRQCGLYIEMKTREGVVSHDQVAFKAAVESRGYATAICRTSFDAINTITRYLTQ